MRSDNALCILNSCVVAKAGKTEVVFILSHFCHVCSIVICVKNTKLTKLISKAAAAAACWGKFDKFSAAPGKSFLKVRKKLTKILNKNLIT